MTVRRDFEQLLACLNAHRVKYVVIGAHALAAHGVVRATADLDLYVKPTRSNAEHILAALADFGFGSLDLTTSDFERPGRVVQLGVEPLRVDFITSIDGVSWKEADAGKIQGEYGDVPTSYLGREELVRSKRAAGRPKDLLDLCALGEK